MKIACCHPFRLLNDFLKRVIIKPRHRNQDVRQLTEGKLPPKKRYHRHGAFFELP